MKLKLRTSHPFYENAITSKRNRLHSQCRRTVTAHKYVEIPGDNLISYFDFVGASFVVQMWSFSIPENMYVGQGVMERGISGASFEVCERLVEVLQASEWEDVKVVERQYDPPLTGVHACSDDWKCIAGLVADGLEHRGIKFSRFDFSDHMLEIDPVEPLKRAIRLARKE